MEIILIEKFKKEKQYSVLGKISKSREIEVTNEIKGKDRNT